MSTLRGATRILVLDRGAVVAAGPHDELLLRSPLYREMWDTQTLKKADGTTDLATSAVSDDNSTFERAAWQ